MVPILKEELLPSEYEYHKFPINKNIKYILKHFSKKIIYKNKRKKSQSKQCFKSVSQQLISHQAKSKKFLEISICFRLRKEKKKQKHLVFRHILQIKIHLLLKQSDLEQKSIKYCYIIENTFRIKGQKPQHVQLVSKFALGLILSIQTVFNVIFNFVFCRCFSLKK